MAALEDMLGHCMADPLLLDEALCHPSQSTRRNYQRLEFLGDRVLGLVIAGWLFREFPEASEGELNRRYTSLVRGETCAEVARQLGLGAHIAMESSAISAGGRANPSVLADVIESVIGALYLDGGFDVAQAFVQRHWRALVDAGPSALKDAKTRLQEWAQGQGLPLPAYQVIARTGPDHAPCFTIEVRVENVGTASGQGPSRRIAEQLAAEALLIEHAGPAA